MKYVTPEIEIAEFDETVYTDLAGPSGSIGNNGIGDGTELPD